MRLTALSFLILLATQAPAQDLDGQGAYDAISIGGFTLPLQDVAVLGQAGILALNPETGRFAFDPAITSERALLSRLGGLALSRPRAASDLYRAAKVALPNSAALALTVPTGYGPARFANQSGRASLSASLGGVNRVPYTSQADGALGLGLSFGNAFTGLGASVMVSANDLSDIGNPDRISAGFALSHYLWDGISLSLGGENLLVRTTDGQESFYLAGTWAFDRRAMPFDGTLTLGVGNGRFADATPRDIFEGRAATGTAVFAALSAELSDHMNLIAEWNGRNLNAGLAYTLPGSGIALKLGLQNLTDHSGDGPILAGSLAATLIRF